MRGRFRILMFYRVVLMLVFSVASSASNDNLTVHKNKDSGLLTWASDENGFSIELIQLLPDFVRAIYAKHDFPDDELERIANYCVFGTIIKNTSKQVMSYKVSNWKYVANNKTYDVKTKTQWLDEWRKVGIIFSWTLLPDSGVFEVGDWQQGFTTIELPRNTKFDLTIEWDIDGQQYNNTLEGIICPPENPPKM